VPVDDTIEQLVARVRRGDPRAFETIVRQHLRSAYVVALAVLQRPADRKGHRARGCTRFSRPMSTSWWWSVSRRVAEPRATRRTL
jgi:hypothetical protein